MPFTVYFAAKFIPSATSLHTLIINSFVHTIMYFYYFLAAFGPQMQPYLKWKKYMTTIQLVQFCIAGIHASHLLFNPNCDYPRMISGLELAESVYFFYFFSMFYKRTYKVSEKKPIAKSNEINGDSINNNELHVNGKKTN